MFPLSFTVNAQLRQYSKGVVNTDTESYITVVSNFKINIQPAGAEQQLLAPQGETGKLYTGFTTMSGIRENMYVVTSGTVTMSGTRYRVLGCQPYIGPLGYHNELLLLRAQE